MESSHKIAGMYHPSSVLVVDDNGDFLERITSQLSAVNRHILCQSYLNPTEALKVIQRTKSLDGLLKGAINVDVASENYLHGAKQLPLQFDISGILQQAYNEDCFNRISVAVIDFKMPQMDGAEFCEQLIHNPVKKIILTGEDDRDFAIKLFNQGAISKFIPKNTPNLAKVLAEIILETQKAYFQDMTSQIIHGLATDHECCLEDPVFVTFFDKTCLELSISSYYLIEPSGSYLLLDDDGLPTWLVIKTQEELGDFVELMGAEKLAPQIIEAVEGGNQMPYFSNDHDYICSTDTDISKYFHPAKKIKGKRAYSYFLTKNLPEFVLDKKRLISFNKHIKTR